MEYTVTCGVKFVKQNISKIIGWLRQMEDLAFHYYRESAERFNSPSPLLSFLLQMAMDKAWRFHLMGSANELLGGYELQGGPLIEIDAETWQNVELPLKKGFHRLRQDNLQESELVESICRAEFSEWNEIFLYVLDICRQYSRTFEPVFETLQDHGSRIESLLEDLPDDLRSYQSLQIPPGTWEFRLLIIDDKGPGASLFSRLLAQFGTVLTVSGERDALHKIGRRLYSLVICNVDSLEDSGTDFFDNITKADPDLVQRILLCTSEVTPELESYGETHGLPIVRKPMAVPQLQKTVHKMLDTTAEPNP